MSLLRTTQWAIIGLALAACTRSGGTKAAGAGEFTAEWIGADTGGLTTRPVARWCEQARRMDVTAIREDVGIALAFYLPAAPGPASPPGEVLVPVFDPGIDTAQPPAVAVASRWFSQKVVAAYQSDSGSVSLSTVKGLISARFGVRLRSLNGEDTVRMTGHFGGVTLNGCPAEAPAAPKAVSPPPTDSSPPPPPVN
jgi:hypothetical protein